MIGLPLNSPNKPVDVDDALIIVGAQAMCSLGKGAEAVTVVLLDSLGSCQSDKPFIVLFNTINSTAGQSVGRHEGTVLKEM